MTGSIVVTLTPFGSNAKLVITNSATSPAFLVNSSGAALLRIRGKGVYDRGPQTYEASTVQPYGVRQIAFELHYQDNPLVTQNYADFIVLTRDTVTKQPELIGFTASGNAAFMTQALTREPGDVITVSETMTGFVSIRSAIQSVELSLTQGEWLQCRFGLAPANNVPLWLWGVVGNAEWGQTTIYGF
jgi:hypothetical protein